MVRPFPCLKKVTPYCWFACLAVLSTGCGGVDGPPRYQVTGEVRYRGNPVPAGEIVFRPDTKKGNDGPGSVARIADGRYQTESGRGVVGGAYIVEIVGFDGISSPESLDGAVLFPPHAETVEFPASASMHDFDLP